MGDLITASWRLLATSQTRTRPASGCSCNATSVGAERRIVDNFACVELGYLTAGHIPQVRFGVPASSQKMHIVRTEHREGRRMLVQQIGRQNPVDVPEPGGAIV